MDKMRILARYKDNESRYNEERESFLRYKGVYYGQQVLLNIWIFSHFLLPLDSLGTSVTGLIVMSGGLFSYIYQFRKNHRTKTVIAMLILFSIAVVFYLSCIIFVCVYPPARRLLFS